MNLYTVSSSARFLDDLIALTILTGKNSALFSIQYKNGWFAASDLFYMFAQSIKFYTFYYYVY